MNKIAALIELLPSTQGSQWDWGIAIPAFLGAALSFLSVAYWDKKNRARERILKGARALVSIQGLANETLSIADKNAYLLRSAIERAEKPRVAGELNTTVLNLRALPEIPLSTISDLLSIDILNLAFRMRMDAGTINADIQTFQALYEKSVM